MSDMKKLLEAIDQFAGGKDQKVGLAGQSRAEGTPKKFVGGVHRQHPDHHKLVGGESAIDDGYNLDANLYSGCYVRDTSEGDRGEVFQMRGDPGERRVRIEDKDGRGWNISPSRLVAVEDQDEIDQWFSSENDHDIDEYADTANDMEVPAFKKQAAPVPAPQNVAIKPKADQRDLDFTSRQFKDIPSLVEELTQAYEDYVKNKSVPDAKKSFKLHKMDGVPGSRSYTVKNEKGEDVMRGNRTDCQAYIDKKNRSLEDDKLEESANQDEIQHWKDMVLHWGRQGNESARRKCLANLKTAQAKNDNKKVKEGTISNAIKSVKRGIAGWDKSSDGGPKEIVKRNKAHSMDTLKSLQKGVSNASPHSPQGLQKKVIDKELAKRQQKLDKAVTPTGELAEDLPGSLSKSDYIPGATKKHESLNCTTCSGRKVMYKLDGKLFADNKKGATKVKCSACNGTGDKSVKEGANHGKKGRDHADTNWKNNVKALGKKPIDAARDDAKAGIDSQLAVAKAKEKAAAAAKIGVKNESRGHKIIASKLKDIESRKAQDKKNEPKKSKAELEKFIKDHEGGGVPTFGKGAEVKRARAELKAMTETSEVNEAVGMMFRCPSALKTIHKNEDIANQIAKATGGRVKMGMYGEWITFTYPTVDAMMAAAKKIKQKYPTAKLTKTAGNRVEVGEDDNEKMWEAKEQNYSSDKENFVYGMQDNNGWHFYGPCTEKDAWRRANKTDGYNAYKIEKVMANIGRAMMTMNGIQVTSPETFKQGVADREQMTEAGGKSENRELWDRIKSRGTTAGIDREKYTERDGLEGPFKMKNGKVVYYDPKEGAYWDPSTDIYLDKTEQFEEKTPGVALSKAYKKDFDGKEPRAKVEPAKALTGQYSKTGKPGGDLKEVFGQPEPDQYSKAGEKKYLGRLKAHAMGPGQQEKVRRLAAKLDHVKAVLQRVKAKTGTQEVDEAFPQDLMPAPAQPGQQQVQQGAMPVQGQQAPAAPAVAGQQPAAPIQGQAQQPAPGTPAPAVGTPMAAQAAVPDMVAGLKKTMPAPAFNTLKQTIAKV